MEQLSNATFIYNIQSNVIFEPWLLLVLKDSTGAFSANLRHFDFCLSLLTFIQWNWRFLHDWVGSSRTFVSLVLIVVGPLGGSSGVFRFSRFWTRGNFGWGGASGVVSSSNGALGQCLGVGGQILGLGASVFRFGAKNFEPDCNNLITWNVFISTLYNLYIAY